MAQVSHREKLLEGAVQCLKDNGYARTTARDIAAASGANLASIGYHFGSKDALLDEALIRLLVARNKGFEQITTRADDAPPIQRLTTAFEAVLRIAKTHRPLVVAFFEALAKAERTPNLRQQMAAFYRDSRREMAEMVRSSVSANADRLRSDPEVMASLLIATFDGLVLQVLLDAADTPSGSELVEALVEWMSLALE